MAKKTTTGEKDQKQEIDTREVLTALLKKEMHMTFEREPAPAFTTHLEKLVDKIINIFE